MPELSIILPVYNVQNWIGYCLDSIAEQSFTDWEAILVDDGSRDLSGVICDSYSRRDPRFRVIHQQNAGVSAARNTGIDAANGALISFIDPDDFISADYFHLLVDSLSNAGADVAQAFIREVLESGEEGMLRFINEWEKCQKGTAFEMLDNAAVVDALCSNLFSCVSWGRVFTRDLWGNARFPVGVDLGEDMMTVPPVIAKAKSAVYVPDAVYSWRERKKSLLHGTVTEERFEKDLVASNEMVQQLAELHPMRREEFEHLRFTYDVGCLANFLTSGNGRKKKASKLFILNDYYQKLKINDLLENKVFRGTFAGQEDKEK
mgnify:FL=1